MNSAFIVPLTIPLNPLSTDSNLVLNRGSAGFLNNERRSGRDLRYSHRELTLNSWVAQPHTEGERPSAVAAIRKRPQVG